MICTTITANSTPSCALGCGWSEMDRFGDGQAPSQRGGRCDFHRRPRSPRLCGRAHRWSLLHTVAGDYCDLVPLQIQWPWIWWGSSIGGSWWDGNVNWGFWLGECFHVSRWSTYSQTADAWKARATRLWPQSWQFLTKLGPKEAPHEAHHRLQWSGYALLALPGLLPMATTCRASNHQSGAGEKTAFLGFVSCRCIVWVSIAVEKIRVEVDDSWKVGGKVSGGPPLQHVEVVAFSGGSTKMVPWHGLCRIGFTTQFQQMWMQVFFTNLLRPAAG